MRIFLSQFIKYGLVGFSNTCIAYIVYAFCVYMGVHYLFANAAGFSVSVINAFYWNNKFVFTKTSDEYRNPWKSLAKLFLTYGFSELVLTSILLFLLIDVAHISEYLSQLLRLFITVPFTFVVNKLWSFKTVKTKY